MALYPASTVGMTWAKLKDGTYVFQATADLTSYSSVSFQAVGSIPQSVIGGSGSVPAREVGIDNSGNSKAVLVMVGKLYSQSVPPFTMTTIELGDTSPMILVTGGGACVLTFSTGANPGTDVSTNPYQASLAALASILPSGSVIMYAGPVGNIPVGWQLCDGSALSRASQVGLYQAIGTLYGAGDGSSTFNVPDMRGKFARGFDNGAGVDNGRILGSSQPPRVGDHQQRLPFGFDNNTPALFYWLNALDKTGGPIFGSEVDNIGMLYQTGTAAGTATSGSGRIGYTELTSIANPGTGDNRPVNVTMNYIIKL